MRTAIDPQLRLGCVPIDQVELNTHCRDEIIPILRSLQFIYADAKLRNTILDLVAADVNAGSRADRGRTGMNYWEILVLASVRQGCNLDYDKLQDLAENHRNLRLIMGIEGWDNNESFDWRCIQDNVTKIRPATIEQINWALVAAGHELAPAAAQSVRGDMFVCESNIHYPTDSRLIDDGISKVLGLCATLATLLGVTGWRQHKSLANKIGKVTRKITSTAKRKGPGYKDRLAQWYGELLGRSESILERGWQLYDEALARLAEPGIADEVLSLTNDLVYYLSVTEHACSQGRRRVLEGESVPNAPKLFSIYEPDTELIKRGKIPAPIQFGHRVLLFEDAAGFICHYAIVPLRIEERQIICAHVEQLQQRLHGRIERLSLDKGFHSPANQKRLAELVTHPCLPATGKRPAANADTVEFREARQAHPGVESAIGALQFGNGLERCRDHSRTGYERYVGLGVLGRNLHVLGKLLIAQEQPGARAAASKRKQHAA